MATPDQAEAVQDAIKAFEPDRRVLALWLEGSLASGDDDAASDVDLHLAVADNEFESFTADRAGLLERIRPPVAFIEVEAPWGLLLPSTLEGLVRVDLVVERRSAVVTFGRDRAPRMLFDRDNVRADVDAAPAISNDPAEAIKGLMRNLWFGSMWPRRFIYRRDWSNLLLNDVVVVHQYAVPAWLIADGSPEFYREWFSVARFLEERRQARVAGLNAHALRAFTGLDTEAGPDLDGLARYHEQLFAAVWGAMREACEATGVRYPQEIEDQYREYYHRELGLEVPAPVS